MTIALLRAALISLASVLCAPIHAQQDDGLAWTDVSAWQLEGRAFADRSAPFDRLPATARDDVRKVVWDLSRHSAGIAARFKTNGRELHVRYRLRSARLAMYHMPATGVSGVDLYAKDDAGRLRWVSVSKPKGRDVRQRLCAGLAPAPAGGREFALYLPLYNGVEALELGVPRGAKLTPLPRRQTKPIVVYGTSIAHGACASRPGMAWPALVSRMLDREVVNLGFSGNGRMEPEVGAHVAAIDAAAFVIDCLPNMTDAQVRERAATLVRQLRRARPDAQILLVEDRTFTNAWILPAKQSSHAARRAALRAAYDELSVDDDRLHYVEGAALIGADDEGATDGSHPNDLGMQRQARAVAAALQAALQ